MRYCVYLVLIFLTSCASTSSYKHITKEELLALPEGAIIRSAANNWLQDSPQVAGEEVKEPSVPSRSNVRYAPVFIPEQRPDYRDGQRRVWPAPTPSFIGGQLYQQYGLPTKKRQVYPVYPSHNRSDLVEPYVIIDIGRNLSIIHDAYGNVIGTAIRFPRREIFMEDCDIGY